jgi:hypothetical protein
MIGRVPRHTTLGDGVDPDVLSVFIPGALASGFLISMGLLMGDAFRKVRGDTGTDRRVMHTGAAVADEVRSGAGASRQTESGLRPRWVYGVVSGISLGLVLAVVPGATWNFLNPGGYISDISWIWVLSLLVVLGFAVVGVQTLRVAPEWLPFILGALGLGLAARFVLGSEPAGLRYLLVAVGLVFSIVGIASTWRMWEARKHTDVPPSARSLLTRTPLTRS